MKSGIFGTEKVSLIYVYPPKVKTNKLDSTNTVDVRPALIIFWQKMKIAFLYFLTLLKASEIPPLPPVDPNPLVLRKLIDENISLNAKYTACRHDLGYHYGQLEACKSSVKELPYERNVIQKLKSQLQDLQSKAGVGACLKNSVTLG